ncbi:MAG TPA: efflux RND transporter periplasmic adaptor subunit [Hanamia sp.]
MKLFKSAALFTLLGIGLSMMISCSSEEKKSTENNSTPVAVTVSSPLGSAEDGINASGQVEAVETANISTRVMGYIMKLNVKVGDHVNAGQVLATINSQDMSAKRAQADAMIAEAEANLKSAQKDFERYTTLYKQQSASAKELDNVTLQYNSAKARVDAAKQMRNEVTAMMNYTTLVAPFSGTIIQKLAETGTLASPGMPLLVMEKSGSYQVSAAIPENEISKIKLKEKAKLNIKSTGKEFNGLVTQINPSSQFSGGQYIVKISVPDNEKKDLYAGMYVNVFIPGKADSSTGKDNNIILVPQSAIVNKDQLKGLYTISTTNTALLRWVRLGKVYGNDVEVISGLNKNEQFILSAEGKLYNGAPVIVKK